MRIAVLADVHSNRQALEACLTQARALGAERFALLGDFVGYGADPEWCVATAMSLVEDGALAVKGNHDSAVTSKRESLNPEAQVAIEWTRSQLSLAQQTFLDELPMTINDEDRLLVHSEASAPKTWNYVSGVDDAVRSLKATPARITLCGHIHKPGIYSLSTTAKVTAFTPTAGGPVPLMPHRRWLIVAGSVGQPRDGDPAAFVNKTKSSAPAAAPTPHVGTEPGSKRAPSSTRRRRLHPRRVRTRRRARPSSTCAR